MDLGKKLKEIRESKGLSLREVESDTGINRGYISRIENGRVKNVSLEKLKQFADYYNISIQELLDREDNWKEKLPEKLRKFVDEKNIGYLEVGLKAKNKGLSPEDVDKMIDIISNQKFS